MKAYLSVLLAVGFIVALGCDSKKDDKKGRSLNIPPLEPPVSEATPAGLDAAAQALRLGLASTCGSETGTPIERMQARLFCPGPGDFRYRLGMVDSRMAELDLRAQEGLPICVDDELKVWNPSLPTGESFPMSFFCYEPMVDDDTPPEETALRVFFGQENEHSYLAELALPGEGVPSHDAPAIAVLARVHDSGDVVEFWQVMWERSNDTSSWMKVVADRQSGTFEFVAAGTEAGFGVGCGVNLKANSELLYIKGVVNDAASPGGCTNQQGGWGEVDFAVDLCLDAETLEKQDLSDCADAGLSEFSLSSYDAQDVAGWDSDELQKAIVSGGGMPSGLRAFTESYHPTVDEEE